jgi:predicted NUDIX family phosphoesterase
MDEYVLVFGSGHMSGFKELSGFSHDDDNLQYLKSCIDSAIFIPRDVAEKSENFKQVIPYVIITKNGKILAYQRSKSSGEERLHDLWSIGFGGHINPEDNSRTGIQDLLDNAIYRELNEELEWGNIYDFNKLCEVGVIYDNSTPVGRVHIGYVIGIDIDTDSDFPQPKENTIIQCTWLSPNEVLEKNLELWSKLVVEAIINAETTSVSR